jgi:hypothetical protein
MKCVVISRYYGENSIPRLLIVKLAWTGWSTPWFFRPQVDDIFHVNLCVTCACACVYFSDASMY